MKTRTITPFAAALALTGLASQPCQAQSGLIPVTPIGTLQAFPTVVQTGTKPTLTWSILYPSKVDDVAVINPPGSIIITDPIYVTVQPICTESDGSCYDNLAFMDPALPEEGDWFGVRGTGLANFLIARPPLVAAPIPCELDWAGTFDEPNFCSLPGEVPPAPPTDIRLSLNGGSYIQLFYGTQEQVDPAKRLYIKKLAAGDTVDFGGRFVLNGAWSPFFTTRSANLQVITLLNGDSVPTTTPLHLSPSLSNYLKPYLDASGKVRIGPMSALILMELNETNHSDACFDYQDVIVLVTFSKQHPNNGHGNNLDGVDVSNPGEGVGGPTGDLNAGLDPSGGVDDEIR